MEVETSSSDSFLDICYECIRDQYYFGLYGDFQLIIDTETVCFNATKLCQVAGKRLRNWFQTKEAKKTIDFFQTKLPNITTMYTISGNTEDQYNTLISGTYLRKELILRLAMWISLEFYYKVTKILENYYSNLVREKYKYDVDERNQLLENIKTINERLCWMSNTFEHVKEDVSPKTKNKNKRHIFELFAKHCDPEFPYYAIRIQNASYKYTIKKLENKYPKMESIFKLEYDPNPINLYNRLKEQGKIQTNYNNIKLINDYSIDNFLNDIKESAKCIV